MTVYECVSYVDEVKPNAFPTNAKIAWLGQLEGRIAAEIFLMAPAELKRFHYRSASEDGSKELLVDPPYDDIYSAYLTAKVDSKNGEYNKLSTAAQAFNRLWDEFSAWIGNMYDPAAGYLEEESAPQGPAPKPGRPPLFDPGRGTYAGAVTEREMIPDWRQRNDEEGDEEFGIVE